MYTYNHCRTCPSGYRLGKLEPHHAHILAEKYTYFNGWENRVPFLKERIRIFDNVAAFSEKDGSLVGWNTYFPGRQHAHFFTFKEHRSKGLGYALIANLCKMPLPHEENVPTWSIIASTNRNNPLITKLGFVNTGFLVDCVVIDVN